MMIILLFRGKLPSGSQTPMVRGVTSDHTSPGETDLHAMLANLRVRERPGPFAVVSLSHETGSGLVIGEGIEALIAEPEGVTVVATLGVASQRGWQVGFVAGWLTLEVHSSLEAVGLTAAIAAALGDAQISCNVLAGFFHDHILVPIERVGDASRCLEELSKSTPS